MSSATWQFNVLAIFVTKGQLWPSGEQVGVEKNWSMEVAINIFIVDTLSTIFLLLPLPVDRFAKWFSSSEGRYALGDFQNHSKFHQTLRYVFWYHQCNGYFLDWDYDADTINTDTVSLDVMLSRSWKPPQMARITLLLGWIDQWHHVWKEVFGSDRLFVVLIPPKTMS